MTDKHTPLTLTVPVSGIYSVGGSCPIHGAVRITSFFDKGAAISAECPWCFSALTDLSEGVWVR